MVTGIDETGDFDPNSDKFNYFVGVTIDQNDGRLTIKRSQFDIWEGSIPQKYKTDKGEVKGQLLPEEYLITFSKTVLEVKPKLWFSVVRIKPNENPVELLDRHKEIEIKQMQSVIDKAKQLGHKNWAKGYEQIMAWYKNKNYQIVMKIKCLENLIGLTVNQSIGWGQLSYLDDNKDITNIRDIEIKIDKDFVRAENVKIIWNESFRQFWRDFTFKNRIPIITEWEKEDHPMFQIYGTDGKLNFTRIFRKKTNFFDSQESWEVRLADVTGTILHRYQNYGKCESIGKGLLSQLSGQKKNYEHLIINDVV